MKRQKKQDTPQTKTTRKERSIDRSKIKKSKKTVVEKISRKTLLLWLTIISVFTIVAYYPSFDNEITNWDDDRYITENPYLKDFTAQNIKDIFNKKSYMGNYHPLAMLSLTIDYQLGGMDENGEIDPFIYHFTNIILHLLVTLLVFWFVWLLFNNFNIAVIAGLLFGVHTLHVESVAWVSERKDVLYALFFVASLINYVKYIKNYKKKYFIYSILFFVLSLLSKGQAVSLAVTLIAVDFLKNRKLLDKRVIIEKIPFFLLSIGFGILAIQAQKEGNAIVSGEAYSMTQRIAFAGFAFMKYIIELVAPVELSAINPYPDIIHKTMPVYYWLFLIPTAAVMYGFYLALKKSRTVTFAMAFFIINIFLLLQLIPVGSAIHADRYTYIPSIGFFILIGFAVNYIIKQNIKLKTSLFAVIGIYTLILTVLTIGRCEAWADSMSLWDDTVKKSPKAVVARNNRGSLQDRMAKKAQDEMKFEQAIKLRRSAIIDFTEAIKGKPDYTHAYYNRGSSEHELGKQLKDTVLIQKAIEDFTKALQFDDKFAEAYHNRGNAKGELNMLEDAMSDFDMAIQLKQEDANFWVNRGVTKGKLGKLDEAIEDFNKAVEMEPYSESAYSNRGLAKAKNGDLEGALKDYNTAIKLKPNFFTAYYNRGITKHQMGNSENAITDFSFVIKNNNKFFDAFYYRAVCYIALNKTDMACSDFNTAAQVGHQGAIRGINKYCK